MAKPTCSKCGEELLLEAAAPSLGSSGGMVVMSGAALTNMLDRTFKQSRACPRCQKNFCTACTMKAGTGGGDTYYVCPDCGMALGSFGTRSSYIPIPVASVAPPADRPAAVPSSPPPSKTGRAGRSGAGKGSIYGGRVLLVVGALIFLLFNVIQLSNPRGPSDNLTGFIGALMLCPVPLLVVGGWMLARGIRARRKTREATEKGDMSSAPSPGSAAPVAQPAPQSAVVSRSTQAIEALLRSHATRLCSAYQGRAGAQDLQRKCNQLLEGERLSFVVSFVEQQLPDSFAKRALSSATRLFADWFVAVTVCPWLTPTEVRANLRGGYVGLLDNLTTPALAQPGGRHIAHWIYCSDGEHSAAHLTLIPNPNIKPAGMAVIAEDLLTIGERQQLGVSHLA